MCVWRCVQHLPCLQLPNATVGDKLRDLQKEVAVSLRLYGKEDLAQPLFDLTCDTGQEDAARFYRLPAVPASMRRVAPYVPTL